MEEDLHVTMDVGDLFASRDCYAEFGPKRFSQRIDFYRQKAKKFGKTPGQAAGKDRKKKKQVHGNKKKSRKGVLAPYVQEDEVNQNNIIQGSTASLLACPIFA